MYRLTYNSPKLLSLWKGDLEFLLSHAVQVAPSIAISHLDAVDRVNIVRVREILAQLHPGAYVIK